MQWRHNNCTPEKDNGVVISNRNKYIKNKAELSKDNLKFRKFKTDPTLKRQSSILLGSINGSWQYCQKIDN